MFYAHKCTCILSVGLKREGRARSKGFPQPERNEFDSRRENVNHEWMLTPEFLNALICCISVEFKVILISWCPLPEIRIVFVFFVLIFVLYAAAFVERLSISYWSPSSESAITAWSSANLISLINWPPTLIPSISVDQSGAFVMSASVNIEKSKGDMMYRCRTLLTNVAASDSCPLILTDTSLKWYTCTFLISRLSLDTQVSENFHHFLPINCVECFLEVYEADKHVCLVLNASFSHSS